MSADKPKGPVTVWVDGGYDGWMWTDYATVEDAVMAQKYVSNWVIQRPVRVVISEADTEQKDGK